MKLAEEGVVMYANIGNYGALMPSSDKFQYKAITLNWEKSIGIIISKDDIPDGSWLKIAIEPGNLKSMTFYT